MPDPIAIRRRRSYFAGLSGGWLEVLRELEVLARGLQYWIGEMGGMGKRTKENE